MRQDGGGVNPPTSPPSPLFACKVITMALRGESYKMAAEKFVSALENARNGSSQKSELVSLYKNGEEAVVEKGSTAESDFLSDGWTTQEAKPKRKPRKKAQDE